MPFDRHIYFTVTHNFKMEYLRRDFIVKQTNTQPICKSIFKSGDDKIDKDYYTKIWIEFINKRESLKIKNMFM